jgi:hypothetical protein
VSLCPAHCPKSLGKWRNRVTVAEFNQMAVRVFHNQTTGLYAGKNERQNVRASPPPDWDQE